MGGGGGWRGGYPCRRDASARRDSWSPKGGTGQPPCSAWVRSWGGGAGGRLGTRGQAKPGWAPEGRAVPLGQAGWTLELCWDLHPRGVLALTPPPLLPSSRHSQCPSTAQFVPPPAPPPPPIPSSHGSQSSIPHPNGSMSPARDKAGGPRRSRSGMSRWGGGCPSPASLVGSVSPSSVPGWQTGGGGRGQSSAVTLDRVAGPWDGEEAGGLSWGCGSGWLRCCRSPGTRWT